MAIHRSHKISFLPGSPGCVISIVVFILIIFINRTARASEKELINLAEMHLKNGEYYNAITESMRYQFLFPGGRFHPRSMLIMGQSFYRGGNYNQAVSTMMSCYERYKNRTEGERALLDLAYMRLINGSSFFAYRGYQEYQYIYPEGNFREEAHVFKCYARALQLDTDGSAKALFEYSVKYPEGMYLAKVRELQSLLDEEVNRPRKSLLVSVIGSIFIPGFGHFYTGNYFTGLISLLSNAGLIYLIYDGYRDDNKFRMIFFSVMEFSFYQYSLFSAVRNVYEYNSKDGFLRSVRLSAQKNF